MSNKDTLMRKFLSGETSLSEEQELACLLRSLDGKEHDAEGKAVLTMLETPRSKEDDSIFTEDNMMEYDRIVAHGRRPAGNIWYTSIAAACIAIALTVFFNKHHITDSTEIMVEVAHESKPVDIPEPSDTVSISSHPEPASQKPATRAKKSSPSRRVVQVPPVNPAMIADTPTAKAPEVDYEEIREVEEELRRNLMRERLNAEIEEKMKNMSQTPDAYIL
ncbi:MAG: hypothetical protein IJL22_05215 [Bacteroidales bacterium]|nr:hypothetical protein [Bacteroidales bacterium]